MGARLQLVFFVCSINLYGCLSSVIKTSKDSRSNQYKIPQPGPGWSAIDPGEADSAYRNNADQSILNVTSVCGDSRFKSLEELSTDILRQLPEHEIVIPSQTATIGGHPGLVTEARGTVDGKTLNVRVAVVRTDRCLFDFILAGQELDPSSRLAFDQSLAGFREKAR